MDAIELPLGIELGCRVAVALDDFPSCFFPRQKYLLEVVSVRDYLVLYRNLFIKEISLLKNYFVVINLYNLKKYPLRGQKR